MEKIFIDLQQNGATFDKKNLKHWKKHYGKDGMRTQQEIDGMKLSKVVTYNDGTIQAVMKNSQHHQNPTEAADPWDDNDEIDDCIYTDAIYIQKENK